MNDMAKIFWSGRSQAVRLPKEYRFDGQQVRISRDGEKVILEPVVEDGWAWLSGLQPMDDDAVAAALDPVAKAAADEIDRLRTLIDNGYASGPSEPFDATEIKRLGRMSQR